MTPELKQLVAGRARSLRARLAPGGDAVAIAAEARLVFEEGEDAIRTRWLNLELNGYEPTLTSIGPLASVLGVATSDRLVAHVAAYRVQQGRQPEGSELRHFFVEPLAQLQAARARTLVANGQLVELTFDASVPQYPTRASFPPDVFARVVEGFIAALYLQLDTVA